LLLVAFVLVNAPNCHLSLVLASVVQGDATNCNKWRPIRDLRERPLAPLSDILHWRSSWTKG